ncbi:hypothetical protein [Frankia sp. CiP3]|uniref:hypothetical protein n=1 Tax=Frankia sp. CiP3 TaxID=2880971 RepID=UPI001EF5F7E3|nr:hypothetical protein [Frankia sp. CiP3]
MREGNVDIAGRMAVDRRVFTHLPAHRDLGSYLDLPAYAAAGELTGELSAPVPTP